MSSVYVEITSKGELEFANTGPFTLPVILMHSETEGLVSDFFHFRKLFFFTQQQEASEYLSSG